MLRSVALGVAAGGDPDYAFKFWLSHEEALATAPTPHPTLELPNHQPALQPKLAEMQPKLTDTQRELAEEQPIQADLMPKQAPLAGAPQTPDASTTPLLAP